MEGKIVTSAEVRSSLDATGYEAGAKRIEQANQRIGSSNDRVQQSEEKVERSRVQGRGAIERLQRSLDTTYRAQTAYEKQLETIRRAQDAGHISLARGNELTALAATRYQALTTTTTAAAAAQNTLAGTSTVLTGALSRLVPYLITAFSVRAVVDFVGAIATAGSEMQQLQAKLGNIAGQFERSRAILLDVFDVAQRAGTGLDVVGDAFTRLSLAARDIGATTTDVTQATETLLKLGRVGGSSMAEVANATRQLGQALASGRLQGDELRSLLENMPLVARAIAEEFGVSVGELRELGSEGKLVADRVLKGLLSATQKANEEFEKLPTTMEQAGAKARNSWNLFAAALDETLGLSEALAASLENVAGAAERAAKRISGDLGQKILDTRIELEKLQKDGGKVLGLVQRPDGTMGTIVDRSENSKKEKELRDRLKLLGAEEAERNIARQTAEAQAAIVAREEALAKAKKESAAAVDEVIQKYDKEAANLAKVAEEQEKLKKAVDLGVISQAKADEILANYRKSLEKADPAAKKLTKAVEKLAEQMAKLETEVAFGEKMAEAAKTGEGAVAALQVELKATTLAQKALADGAIKAGKEYEDFVARVIALEKRKADADYLKNFRLGTRELEMQNKLLEAELRLAGELPEVRNRELAVLKVKLDLQKQGRTLDQAEIDARVAAVEKQNQLNDQIRKAAEQQELLLEPFRNFIKGMQDALGRFFEDLFDGNVGTWKDAFATVKSLAKQFAIEMLKLLTIRPVINWLTGSAGGLPGTSGGGIGDIFGSLFGGGGGYAGTGASGGGIGDIFGSLFGGGGSGGFGSFLSRPLSSFGIGSPGLDPTGASAYLGLPEAGGLGGFIGNLGVGQALGAVGGAAGGIAQLLQGGTANTIGGIASLVGAGVSLIPGVGQILGPLISIAGPLLGGLFGKKPKIPQMRAQLLTTGLGTLTSGPNTPFQGTDFTHTTPFGLLGYSGAGTNKRFDDPNGEAGDLLRAVADMDRAIAELLTQPEIDTVAAALQSTPGIKTSWKKAFDNEGFDIVKDRLETTLRSLYGDEVATQGLSGIARGNDNIEELVNRAGEVIQVANAIKGLGIVATDAEKAIEDINEQFDELTKKAEQYGFAAEEVAKIDVERRKQVSQVAAGFNEAVADQLLGYADPYALAQKKLADEQEKRLKEAQYLVEQFEKGLIDTLVDVNKLEELFGQERVQLQENFLEQLGAKWSDFEKELLFGASSGLTNRQQYEAAMREYQDVRGRAESAYAANDNLDPALAAEFQREALAALQWSRTFQASSSATQDLYDQVLALTRQFGDLPGFAAGGYAGAGWARVGERGPEIVRFLRPAQVFDAATSARMTGGGFMPGAESAPALGSALREALAATLPEVIRNNAQGQGQMIDLLERLIGLLQQQSARDRADDAGRAARGARRRQAA